MEHTLGSKKQINGSLKVFLLGLLVAGAAFLPFIVYHGGYFFYYGDFNVQQIPFYQLAHEAVRSGNIWWSWTTDLGANFIGSYSFYLLFSPFFWLTLPFPTSFVPCLMAPLLILKHACAGVTAFWYIRRFVKNRECAAYCALLYAFSGFTVYNIFFNHFHEAIVFFPLLLIGLEKAMTENKRGAFALGIFVNCVVNYWFFVGEAVFVAVYFFIRLTSTRWKLTPRKFFSLGLEVALGMGLSMAAFLPSVLAIMGNPRTTGDTILLGTSLWYYSNPQRYLGILHSFFFAPDLPALNNLFPDHGAQWASLSAYLPLVGAVPALAYWFTMKRDWLKKMLGACALLALVPLGNHLFVALNHSYYTRWLYMPTLLLVLACALVMEHPREFRVGKGIRATAGALLIILVISGLTPRKVDGAWVFGIYRYLPKFLVTAGLTLAGFLLFAFILYRWQEDKKHRKFFYRSIIVSCMVFTFSLMLMGKVTYPNNDWMIFSALPGRDRMLPESQSFGRSDIYNGSENIGMYWNLPNIQAFHSIVPASLMEFYPQVGVKRDVSSKPEARLHYLRPLLSVRWLYIAVGEENQEPMHGYTLVGQKLGYNIYENDFFIPMGFSYDYVIRPDQWEALPQDYKSRALLYGVYLDDETADAARDLLEPVPEDWMYSIVADEWETHVMDRRTMTCDTFDIDNRGFTATTVFDRPRLLFFSVPYDKGWRAAVNGREAEIIKANIGFMAVRVPAGEAEIRFDYTTPGLKVGLAVSGASLLLLLGFVLVPRHRPGLHSPEQTAPESSPVLDGTPFEATADGAETEEQPPDPPGESTGETNE